MNFSRHDHSSNSTSALSGTGTASYDPGDSPRRDTPVLGLSLGRDPRAPSLARAALRTFSEDAAIAAPVSATLALLVSELVTNAVLHSESPAASAIHLQACRLDGRAVRVEVVDAGNGFTASPRGPVTTGGFGLFLVDEQASRWGVDREGGTRVWFELDTRTGEVEISDVEAEPEPVAADPKESLCRARQTR